MTQRTEQDLKSMSPDQIVAAHDAGELDELLGRLVASPVDGQLDASHLATMAPEAIVAAHDAGRLDGLLGRQ